MGLYVADMVLNFKSLSFPWLRLIWIGATLAYFLVASITQVSSLSLLKTIQAVFKPDRQAIAAACIQEQLDTTVTD